MKLDFKKTEQKIDWNKQQLVISTWNDLVVLTNGIHNKHSFEGLCIDIDAEFSTCYDKSAFVLFNGTISND